MIYDDYVKSLNERALEAIGQIDTGTNLDLGPEFEYAVWHWLRQAIPVKYGVCRGYMVNKEGERAGDDLIVYDRSHFPVLRASGEPRFDRKEKIPVEAVYGYIEVKHVLTLDGPDESGGQTLETAVSQVARAKALLRTRAVTRRLPLELTGPPRKGFPKREDWPFGAIVCNGVRRKKGMAVIEDPGEIEDLLKVAIGKVSAPIEDRPNLIIAGAKCVMVPGLELPSVGEGKHYQPVPFVTDECVFLVAALCDEIGFGFGLAAMLYAFEEIVLPDFHWADLINDAWFSVDRLRD